MFLDSPLSFYLATKTDLWNKFFQVLCVSGACIALSFALVFKSPETEVLINGFMGLNQRCDYNLHQ